eukprot:COSAG03_NODE_3488_length_1986_cov_1.314255_2_plen_315_part_00
MVFGFHSALLYILFSIGILQSPEQAALEATTDELNSVVASHSSQFNEMSAELLEACHETESGLSTMGRNCAAAIEEQNRRLSALDKKSVRLSAKVPREEGRDRDNDQAADLSDKQTSDAKRETERETGMETGGVLDCASGAATLFADAAAKRDIDGERQREAEAEAEAERDRESAKLDMDLAAMAETLPFENDDSGDTERESESERESDSAREKERASESDDAIDLEAMAAELEGGTERGTERAAERDVDMEAMAAELDGGTERGTERAAERDIDLEAMAAELELEESNAPQAGEVEDDETMSELAAQLLLLEE